MVFIIGLIVSGLIGGLIGSGKGIKGTGIVLGLLLGPIGWLITALMKGDLINCPHCKSQIDPLATTCPKCTKVVQEDDGNFPIYQKWRAKKISQDPALKHISSSEMMAKYEKEKNEYAPKEKVKEESLVKKSTSIKTANEKDFMNFEEWKSIYFKRDSANKFLSDSELGNRYQSEKEKFLENNLNSKASLIEEKTIDINDIENRLIKLKELKEKELIDIEEYRIKKDEILTQL